ncbi:hypothetical protein LTS15_008445 [Exophiala xenobiotica]|nr:hypothetical protein LTS15_008445 [Exophiala xenobiotica]
MPPPMPNPAKRMTANPAKPVARYRPGKPVAEQESSDEEEEHEEEQPQQPQRKPQPRRPPPKRPAAPVRQESEDEDEDDEGFVTEEEDQVPAPAATLSQQSTNAASTVSRPVPLKQESTQPRSEEESSEEEEEEEESASEESSSSEDEQPQRKFQRPTFIRKTDRSTSIHSQTATPDPSATADVDTARRRAQAELLIKDKLERDILARAAGKKSWDDDDELLPESMVDDTDGLDPEAEYAAWKVRELKRLKRDREALIAREKEIEETERRRNLTAEEREREDKEFLEKQREERESGRGQEAQFMARYHHKGAFFQGDEVADVLKRRNVMGARFEDEVSDKSVLPEYMRLRDMTKLGKKGGTRYRDLKSEDTGRFGDEVKRWRGSGGADRTGAAAGGGGKGEFDTRGLDERFLPDDQRGGGGGRTGPTGANASGLGSRKDSQRDRDGHGGGGDRSKDRERASHDRRKRSYSRSRSRPRSRSRSPRRQRRDSPSPYHDRDRNRGTREELRSY